MNGIPWKEIGIEFSRNVDFTKRSKIQCMYTVIIKLHKYVWGSALYGSLNNTTSFNFGILSTPVSRRPKSASASKSPRTWDDSTLKGKPCQFFKGRYYIKEQTGRSYPKDKTNDNSNHLLHQIIFVGMPFYNTPHNYGLKRKKMLLLNTLPIRLSQRRFSLTGPITYNRILLRTSRPQWMWSRLRLSLLLSFCTHLRPITAYYPKVFNFKLIKNNTEGPVNYIRTCCQVIDYQSAERFYGLSQGIRKELIRVAWINIYVNN